MKRDLMGIVVWKGETDRRLGVVISVAVQATRGPALFLITALK